MDRLSDLKQKNSTAGNFDEFRCYWLERDYKNPFLHFNTHMEEMSMYGNYLCEVCGCSLDPGEGSVCDDCRSDLSEERRREKELDRMIRSINYQQMEMEEFLHA